ncbi:hypothetical protein GDO86_010288 [Hymenochirus boettgeri]|uniref:G-protein coupled receptors family 1 profile domain-containing protein n=1 Tax=Hymenochirus boettgeri TaxID=247094 RepID=A0A8T2JJU8_9PIPI|nr:hypothetical protein GDO86_010288 [Hymenochirus boettgeri]
MKLKNEGLVVFQVVLFAIILFFGTLFNSFAIWVFFFKIKKWTETRVFMMTLLFSDCCLLITIPFRIYAALKTWDLPDELCKFLSFAYFMNTYLSIAIITLISVDRFIAIRFPFKARSLRSPKKAAMACVVVFILLLSTRIYIWIETLPDSSNITSPGVCFRKTSARPLKRSLYFTILGFFIPLPIILLCSIKVIRYLKKKGTVSVYEDKCIQKSINIVSANLVIFLFCFLPLHIGNILRFVMESIRTVNKIDCSVIRTINDYVYATQVIGDLNCCLDSVCYYFVAKEFWESTSILPKSNQFLPFREPTEQSNV